MASHVSQCMARPMHVGHMACHVCDTWHAMCQHAWHFKSCKYGSSNSVRGGSSKEKEEEGKREREERRREREEKKRKGKNKNEKKKEEERKKKDEKEGVSRSEQTQTAKN